MPEYIDREAAIAALCCDCSATGDCKPGERCADYMRLKSIPAADVQPVVRGKWERTSKSLYACSECGNCVVDERITGMFFCPNCGADMREKS